MRRKGILLLVFPLACLASLLLARRLAFPAPKLCFQREFTARGHRDGSVLPHPSEGFEALGQLGGKPISLAQSLPGELVGSSSDGSKAYVVWDDDLWQVERGSAGEGAHIFSPRGNTTAVWVKGDRAYLAVADCEYYGLGFGPSVSACGEGLYVLDLAASAQGATPAHCYESDWIASIAAAWNRALPAAMDGLLPTAEPFELRNLRVYGNYAYLMDVEKGLRIVDVSDPARPIEVASYNTTGNLMEVLRIGEKHLLAALYGDEGGLEVIELDGRGAPLMGRSELTGLSIADLALAEPYAYLAAMESGLRILEVSNPEHLVEVGSYRASGLVDEVVVANGYAFVSLRHPDESEMQVIDVSTPHNPRLVGTFPLNEVLVGLATGRGTVLVGDWVGNVRIIDVSDPSNPTLLTEFKARGRISDVQIVGDTAYIAARSGGLQVVDLSDPRRPGEVAHYRTAWASGVDVLGELVYLSDLQNGLTILRFRER